MADLPLHVSCLPRVSIWLPMSYLPLHVPSVSPLRVQVTHFVKPGTELDEEAKRRCTTIYLIQEAIPMLPRLLSETLCSLNEGVDRLAFSCIWNMTPDGKVDYGVPIW